MRVISKEWKERKVYVQFLPQKLLLLLIRLALQTIYELIRLLDNKWISFG